jgi:hypothetical protein
MYNITDKNLSIINNLVYKNNLKPNFEEIKYCLIWNDEVPEGIYGEARELLYDLIIYRGLVHRNLPFSEWPVDIKYFQDAWEFGLKNIPNWPGFNRVSLSEEDQQYLFNCINDES